MRSYKNSATEVYAADSYERLQLAIHDLRTPDSRGRLAMEIMRTTSFAGFMDTHPGAQRMTAADVAKHACDVADAAFNEFESRGWLIDVPDMQTIREDKSN